MHWWECAAQSGHADSAYCLGLFLQASRDPEGAEAYYRLSAKSEHPGAASQLGGIALSRRDLRSARAWYEQAAGAGRLEDQRMAGFVCVELGDARGASHWFGRGAAGGDAESAFNFGLLLIAEFGDLGGGQHWFRQAALAGHHGAAVELGGLLSAAGRRSEAEEWLADPPPPTWDRPAEPELMARAELAAAATGRRGGVALAVPELAEILGTWDLVTRPLHDHADVIDWLVNQSRPACQRRRAPGLGARHPAPAGQRPVAEPRRGAARADHGQGAAPPPRPVQRQTRRQGHPSPPLTEPYAAEAPRR